MKRARLAALVVALPFLAMSAQCQEAASAKKPLTPEALLEMRGLGDFQYSPDGTRLAFVVSDPIKERRTRHIWLYETNTGAARQITYSEKSESTPRWSPDGKQLAFLSGRGEEEQIYLMRMDGGEGVAISKSNHSAERFAWSPDGKTIAFLASDAKTDAETKKEKDKDDARVVDKDDKHTRVWLLDVAKREERAITDAKWEVSELEWLPNGSELIISATDKPELDKDTNRIFLLKPTDGALRQLFAPKGPFGNVQVSQNGSAVSYVGSREDGPTPHDLLILPIGAPASKNLTGASLDRPVMDYRWQKDGSVLLNVLDGFRAKFVTYSQAGVREDAPAMPVSPRQFAVSANGDVAFEGVSATEAGELWIWKKGQQPKKVTNLNAAIRAYTLVKPEIYKYKSFDGTEIEASLLKPAGYDGKSKLPLIALVHGGPAGAWEDSIDSWGQLLVQHGFAVFSPNIRGSLGYGQKFLEMNRADWGGNDFKDVMAGVDDLVAKGVADTNKLGIGGWSYGGFMSEWAITQTDRFKGAVSGAGMANLISEFGTESSSSYDEWYWGTPYERPEGFLNHSPFLYLKHAKTPTLILQGEADTTDPIGQSQELYRGLKMYNVPAELVLYPREPHGLQEAKHRVDMETRMVDWFVKYVK